jgi:hypothetical protein
MASPKTREINCPELGAGNFTESQREGLTREFLAEMARQQTGKRADAAFLNKNPHLCNKLPLVQALFPDARFIWIHRRLLRVVASLKRLFEDLCRREHTWHCWPVEQSGITARCWGARHFQRPKDFDFERVFPGGRIRFLAEYWLESNRSVSQFFQNLPDEQKLAVCEEELIERPTEELSRCLTFLGQELPGSLMNVHFDGTRNARWTTQITAEEQLELLAFIEETAAQLDTIFPGESGMLTALIWEAIRQADMCADQGKLSDGFAI